MERALELYALLPESLTDGVGDGSDAPVSNDPEVIAGDDTNAESLVWVRLVDSAGRTLFENGAPTDLLPAAQAEIGGRFGNLSVEAAIPRSSADRLVIGGAYGVRLPLIVGTLAITVVVMLVGVGLLRREQELVHLREQFIAGASHELRTPLAQLRMFTETLLLERVRSSEEQRRALQILDREARRLAFLVENLLQFSSPRQPTSFVPAVTALGRLVADVVESFAPLAAARGVRIEVHAPDGIEAFVDRDMLQQVLLNLLDNAVKYGPDNQTVTVELTDQAQAGANDAISGGDDGRIAISVSDQGPGVPEPDRLRVWERFWRGRSTNGVTGTGIGLAVAKEIVVLHGGEIRVEDAPGGGARFVVRLPRAAP
jgi:signal transduction histidine kinase